MRPEVTENSGLAQRHPSPDGHKNNCQTAVHDLCALRRSRDPAQLSRKADDNRFAKNQSKERCYRGNQKVRHFDDRDVQQFWQAERQQDHKIGREHAGQKPCEYR